MRTSANRVTKSRLPLKSLERYIILNADRSSVAGGTFTPWTRCARAFISAATRKKDPLIEYKTEAYDMFVELMANIKNEVLNNLFRSTSNLQAFENFLATLPQFLLREEGPTAPTATADGAHAPSSRRDAAVGGDGDGDGAGEVSIDLPIRRSLPKVGRNEACPCGSGKKYKNCCGASHNRALRQGPTASASR